MKFFAAEVQSFSDIQQNFEQLQGFLGFPSGSLAASGAVTLTTAIQSVPGTSLTVRAGGTFLVMGVFSFLSTVTGWSTVSGFLNHNGAGLPSGVGAFYKDSGAGNQGASVAQNWTVACQVGDTLQLSAQKGVNAGTVQTNATSTTMTYLRIS